MNLESRTRAFGRLQAFWNARKEAKREQERQGDEEVDQERLIDAIMVGLNFDTAGGVQRLVVPMPGTRDPPTQGATPELAMCAEAGDGDPSTPDQEGPDVVVEEGSEASWVSGVQEEEATEGAVGGCRALQALPVAIWRPNQVE